MPITHGESRASDDNLKARCGTKTLCLPATSINNDFTIMYKESGTMRLKKDKTKKNRTWKTYMIVASSITVIDKVFISFQYS